MNLMRHLAESTLFAAFLGLLTLAFRREHARVRHWLWMAASLKFLVPFSVLIAAGSQLAWRAAPAPPPPQLTFVIADARQPSELPPPMLPAPAPPSANWISPALWGVWACGALAILTRWSIRWRNVAAIRRAAQPIDHPQATLLVSQRAVEPGVVGIFKPVVMVPAGLAGQLSADQWESVLAHELCHIRRNDNLAGALHMLVEAIFWFHPMVWWIGARLVEERERACDEEVLRLGKDPEIYAESILKVCEFCLESPLPCVSGISGADLERRIATIMARHAVRPLERGKKALLAAMAVAAAAGPLTVGLLHAPPVRAQTQAPAPLAFEVASVKRLDPKEAPTVRRILSPSRSGGTIHWVTNGALLVRYAFRLQGWRVSGVDFGDDMYQIDAKTDPGATEEQIRLMMQTLLTERFKLAVHRETRELNGYVLSAGKNGPKLKPVPDDGKAPDMPEYLGRQQTFATTFEGRAFISVEGKGNLALTGRRVTMEQIAEALQEAVHTFVLDKTELAGKYYVGVKFANPEADSELPSLAAVLQEELGLKLEKQKAPVDMLVVDRIAALPVEN